MNSLIVSLLGRARWFVVSALLCGAFSTPSARAQNENAAAQPTPPAQTQAQPPHHDHLQLLPQLNLSPEQHAQLLAIARQHHIELNAAQLRLREARRALNQAIYAEHTDQNIVRERAHEVAVAQETLINLNAQSELKVRQVLTPEQLRRFRQLRRRQRGQQRIEGQPGGAPRDGRPHERFPGAGRPPNAPPNATTSPDTPVQPRARRQRRPFRGAGRMPRP